MRLVEVLLRLQSADQEWEEKAQRYQQLKQQLQDEEPLAQRRQALAQQHKEHVATRAALKDAELQVASLSKKHEQVVQDLYGGRIRSPKELENLGQESKNLKQHISELEEHALRLMTQVDELASVEQADEEDLALFEQQLALDQREGLAEWKVLRARLQELKATREELGSQVPTRTLALYHELWRTKAGTPLAESSDSVCSTCRVHLSTHKAQLVQLGEKVVLCDGCGRILYTN
jgi:hypothetical protein